MRFCILFLLLFVLNTGFSQKRIRIKDPEIEFSLELPKKWKTQNDDYYFFVLNPKWENTQLTLTYYNENTPRQLDEIVDTRLRFSYPEIDGFKHKDTGFTEIDGVQALWVKYESKLERNKMLNVEYIFLKEGQVWYVLTSLPEEDFDSQHPILEEVVLSLQCRYR